MLSAVPCAPVAQEVLGCEITAEEVRKEKSSSVPIVRIFIIKQFKENEIHLVLLTNLTQLYA